MTSVKSYTHNHCVYTTCKAYRKRDRKLRFYTFPVKDEKRCKMWILNSGNLSLLDLPEHILKYLLICERHFLKWCFRDFTAPVKYLNQYAVPLKYNSTDDEAQQPVVVKKEKKSSFGFDTENIKISDANKIVADQFHSNNSLVTVKKETASEEDEFISREMEILNVANFLRKLNDETYSKCMKEVIVPMMQKINHPTN